MIVLFTYLFLSIALPTVKEMRTHFHESGENKSMAQRLMDETKSITEKDAALYRGYKGAALMMYSQYEKGAFTKLGRFNEGKPWLEKAITESPNTLELRYLRFTFQSTVPSILHYSANVETDKAFILKKTPASKDADLKQRIRAFMLASKKVSDKDKQIIRAQWSK